MIPELGRASGEGNGNSLQYFCLENYEQRSLVGYGPWGLKKSARTEQLTLSAFLSFILLLIHICSSGHATKYLLKILAF